MSHIFVRNERIIDAKPEEVYGTLTDYKDKRPRMLTPNFLDYLVEKGGKGDGTVISYRLHAGGRERPYQMKVSETVKGKIITEQDTNSSLVTRWSVLPLNNGQQCRVSIESDWQGGSGIGGFFERTFAPMGLHKIYDNILTMLALLVQSPEKNQAIVQQSEGSNSQTRTLLIAAGSVLALAAGIGYLRNRQK
jgi:hypothetical protein